MSKFLLKETTVDYIASDYWRYTGARASLLKMFRNTFCNHCFAYIESQHLKKVRSQGWLKECWRNCQYGMESRYRQVHP